MKNTNIHQSSHSPYFTIHLDTTPQSTNTTSGSINSTTEVTGRQPFKSRLFDSPATPPTTTDEPPPPQQPSPLSSSAKPTEHNETTQNNSDTNNPNQATSNQHTADPETAALNDLDRNNNTSCDAQALAEHPPPTSSTVTTSETTTMPHSHHRVVHNATFTTATTTTTTSPGSVSALSTTNNPPASTTTLIDQYLSNRNGAGNLVAHNLATYLKQSNATAAVISTAVNNGSTNNEIVYPNQSPSFNQTRPVPTKPRTIITLPHLIGRANNTNSNNTG
jgi:hypothetical protein